MHFPINVVVRGRRVVVIGGGEVATRKVARLINYSANVVVISPEVTPTLEAMEESGKLRVERRPYEQGDLEEAWLVFAASDDDATNFEVAEEGHRRGALVSVVSDPDAGDFSLPVIAEIGGGVKLAIDTQGAVPALTRKLRQHLEDELDPGWGRGARIVAALRLVVSDRDDADTRAEFFESLVGQLPDAGNRDIDGLREWIHDAINESMISLDTGEVETLLKLM